MLHTNLSELPLRMNKKFVPHGCLPESPSPMSVFCSTHPRTLMPGVRLQRPVHLIPNQHRFLFQSRHASMRLKPKYS